MLRAGELLAFCAPFLVFLIWRRVAAGPGPSRTTLALTLLGLACFGAALAWFGVHRALAPEGPYIPAQVVDGHIVQGHSGSP